MQYGFDNRVAGVQTETIENAQILVNKYVYEQYGITYCLLADGSSEILTVKDGEIRITVTESDFEKHI